MTRNADGSVTTKTPGKVATTPTGSGTAQVKPVQARPTGASGERIPDNKNTVVPKKTVAASKSRGGGRRGRGK